MTPGVWRTCYNDFKLTVQPPWTQCSINEAIWYFYVRGFIFFTLRMYSYIIYYACLGKINKIKCFKRYSRARWHLWSQWARSILKLGFRTLEWTEEAQGRDENWWFGKKAGKGLWLKEQSMYAQTLGPLNPDHQALCPWPCSSCAGMVQLLNWLPFPSPQNLFTLCTLS